MTPADMTIEDAEAGLPDHVFDLVLLLQQAASDVVRCAAFAEDARAAGDDELVRWFRELADCDRQIVSRARALLADRLRATAPS